MFYTAYADESSTRRDCVEDANTGKCYDLEEFVEHVNKLVEGQEKLIQQLRAELLQTFPFDP